MADFLRLIDVNAGGFRLKKSQVVLHPRMRIGMRMGGLASILFDLGAWGENQEIRMGGVWGGGVLAILSSPPN